MVAQAVSRPTLRLFPRQMRFVLDPARYPGYVGGIGSGKSFAGAAKVIARLDRKELGLVAAPSYPMMRDATRRTLLELLESLTIPFVFHKSDNIVTVPSSGHEIMLRSLDDADAVRGPNVHYCWVDEASLVPFDAWRVVIGRARLGHNPQRWATFTPKGRNWCWEWWERDASPDRPLYRVRTDENPELPPDFSQSLGYAGRFAEQELGGEFVAFEGLVYPGFGRQQVQRIDCDGWETVLGLDVGTRNPTALLTVRYAGDRIHVERELYRRGMDAEEIPAAVAEEAERSTPAFVVIDPSAAGVIKAVGRRDIATRRANNDVQHGIRCVTAVLPDLTIDPSCVNLIAEFESYAYPENRQERDAPTKAKDHALDALRYVVMALESGISGRLFY